MDSVKQWGLFYKEYNDINNQNGFINTVFQTFRSLVLINGPELLGSLLFWSLFPLTFLKLMDWRPPWIINKWWWLNIIPCCNQIQLQLPAYKVLTLAYGSLKEMLRSPKKWHRFWIENQIFSFPLLLTNIYKFHMVHWFFFLYFVNQ